MIGCWVIDKEEWEISTKALINQGMQTPRFFFFQNAITLF